MMPLSNLGRLCRSLGEYHMHSIHRNIDGLRFLWSDRTWPGRNL